MLQRRFNQSAVLAKGLSGVAGVPVLVTALQRKKRTAAQVGLTHEARRENVAQAFHVEGRNGKRLAGKNVLLIDDVLTTGATANACAAALLDAGAVRVDVLAIALVSHGLDGLNDELD